MASALTRHPAVIELDRDESDRLFAAVLRDQPLLLNIVLTDSEGTIKGSGVPVGAGLDKLATMDQVRQVVSTGKPVVSELLTGAVSGKPTVVLAYPVREPCGIDRWHAGARHSTWNVSRRCSAACRCRKARS